MNISSDSDKAIKNLNQALLHFVMINYYESALYYKRIGKEIPQTDVSELKENALATVTHNMWIDWKHMTNEVNKMLEALGEE